MSVRSIATQLAAVPQQAIERLPSLQTSRRRPRRSGSVGEIIAGIGLGLALGIAIGLLLGADRSVAAQADPTSGEPPAQYT